MLDIIKNSRIIIFLCPIVGLTLILFFLFAEKPIYIMGQANGPMKIEDYYRKLNTSLNSAYVYKNKSTQAECLNFSKEYFLKNNYKYIDDDNQYGQTIRASKQNHILLVRCTYKKSNINFIAGYGVSNPLVSSKIRALRNFLKEKIQDVSKNRKVKLNHNLAWISNEINSTEATCLLAFQNTYIDNNITINNKKYNWIYGQKNNFEYISMCNNGAYSLFVVSNNNDINTVKERAKIKKNFYSKLK